MVLDQWYGCFTILWRCFASAYCYGVVVNELRSQSCGAVRSGYRSPHMWPVLSYQANHHRGKYNRGLDLRVLSQLPEDIESTGVNRLSRVSRRDM